MTKDFIKWNKIKSKLNERQYKPPKVKEGDVYWFSFGLNIGSEIDGKGNNLDRPGLIYKIISKTSYLIIPLTTSEHYKSKWNLDVMNANDNKKSKLCFNEIRRMDFRRMKNFIFSLKNEDMLIIEKKFIDLYKINLPSPNGEGETGIRPDDNLIIP